MFWKKKTEQPKEKEKEARESSPGFFSTDIDFTIPRSKMLRDAVARVFQKKVTDFPIAAPEGVAMDAMGDQIPLKAAYQMASQNIPDVQFSWYSSQSFIGHQTCAIIAQHWLVDKACSMPAKDAIRNGWDITVNDGSEVGPEVLDYIRECDKRFRLTENLVDFVRTGRIFGIRIAMFLVDEIDYSLPFNLDGVKPGSYRGITQIDPYWLAPELDIQDASNPMSPNFYEPTWWRVNGKRVHRSHLKIFRTNVLPDILKPSYLYGGVPVPQKIFERVYAAERTANEAPQLAMTKRTNAIHTDVAAALADQGAFEDRMNQWAYMRDNYGVKVLGQEEQMEQFETSLSDLDAVIMTQYQIVAAAAGVPATKLLGTSPKGFNATGEFEMHSYHEELESIQAHDLTPFVERHYDLLVKSYVAPKFSLPFFNTVPTWKPVNSMTAKELAEVNKMKADTDAVLAQIGSIDGEDSRNRLIADPDSGYTGIAQGEYEEEAPDEEAQSLGQ